MLTVQIMDVIARRRVEGFRSAVADDRTDVGKEPVGVSDTFDRVDDLVGPMVILIGKAVDLIAVEHCVGLQERDIALDLIAAEIRLGLGEEAGVDDGRAGFALSDLRPDLACLTVGHPERCLETPGEALRPEQEDIDAGICLTGMPERPRDPAFEASRAPGFHPWPDAVVQIGNDGLGDPRIDIDARAFLFPFHFQTS